MFGTIRRKDRRRNQPRFHPQSLDKDSNLVLEERNLTAPMFQLATPPFGQSQPGIFAFLTSGSPDTITVVSSNQTDGVEDLYIAAGGNVGDDGTVATWSANVTNLIYSPSTSQVMPGIGVTIILDNSYGTTVPGPNLWLNGIETYAQTGANGPNGGPPPPVVWNLVDDTGGGLWDPGTQGALTITTSISVTYKPVAPAADGWDNPGFIADPVNPFAGSVEPGGTWIAFQATAAGVAIAGPTLDPSTGNSLALAIVTPGSGGVPAFPGGPGGGPNITYYDNFFLSGGTENFIFHNTTTANQESIRYAASLLTGQSTASPGGDGFSQLYLNYTESVSVS